VAALNRDQNGLRAQITNRLLTIAGVQQSADQTEIKLPVMAKKIRHRSDIEEQRLRIEETGIACML